MIALTEAYRNGLFKPKYWLSNLTAGTTVGIIALPLAMAFAMASGMKPEQGLYTAIIAALIVGVFGGSRVQIAGPTGAFIVILLNIVNQYGISGLQIATLLAGFILLLMGVAKLGNIIKFIPDPVIVGFTSGIGVIIFVGQWKDFFGLSVGSAQYSHFHEKLFGLLKALSSMHLPTLGLACLTLIVIIIIPKFVKRLPAFLVAMTITTLVQTIFQFEDIATIGNIFGQIPQHLPRFQFPEISLDRILELISPAFAIALLGAIESLLSAVIADSMSNTRHDANQELIGQGLANIICPLFGGFAATGAIARTAANIRHGGNSPLSSIVHSLTLLSIILIFAPLIAYIPLCTFSAILFVVAYNMSQVRHFIHILKNAPRNDSLVLLTTFLLTIFVDLIVAVNVGVILALFLFVHRMSQSVIIDRKTDADIQAELIGHDVSIPNNVLIYTIQGPFFFATIEVLGSALDSMHNDPSILIFRLKHVPFMDVTGLQAFYEAIEKFYKRGVNIYLCEANTKVSQKLSKMNILQLVKGNQIFNTFPKVLEQLKKNI